MSYDAEDMQQAEPPSGSVRPMAHKVYARDLEAIVTLIELAALELSPESEVTFTRDALLETARMFGGPHIDILEKDFDIVLRKSSFIKKVGANEYYLK